MSRDQKHHRSASGAHRLGSLRSGSDGLVEDMTAFRREFLNTRHPSYHAVLGVLSQLLAGDTAEPRLVAAFDRLWGTRSFPTFYERPLLVLAALRFDALQEGAAHPLYGALAAASPNVDGVTRETVASSLGPDRLGIWSALATRRVQTNDTGRAVAWLWPALLGGCDQGARPLALVDVGASAGLNLIGDALAPMWTDHATHAPLPTATRVHAVARLGFDARPLDFRKDQDLAWIRACIWAGETDRLQRFEAAVRAMRVAASRPSPPQIELLTASLVPERLVTLASQLPARTLTLAYQTLVVGYMASTERESYRAGMTRWVAAQPAGSALWIELELDDARRRMPVVFTAHVRSDAGVRSLAIGRANQHPTEIEVNAAAVSELSRCLALKA
jgi:hypothetical protein